MQELNHKTCKPLEGTWDAHSRRNFDQYTFRSVNVYLEFASFVDWRIQQGEETLEIQHQDHTAY